MKNSMAKKNYTMLERDWFCRKTEIENAVGIMSVYDILYRQYSIYKCL